MSAHVVVVGAGLTGLTLAFRLREAGLDVTIVERLERTGGQIHSVRDGGVVVELGAEGFVARSEALVKLSEDVGVGGALIDQETTLTYALEDGALRALADGEAARILGFQVKKEQRGQGIRSLTSGMGQLPDKLTEVLSEGITWRRGEAVEAIHPRNAGLNVTMASGDVLVADAAVVTTPTPAAIAMLGAFEAAAQLSVGRRLSNASATLVYDRDRIAHPLDGSGFIVPAAAKGHGFRACSFVSTKFARDLPPNTAILRAFFRPTDQDLASRDEASWIALAVECVSPVLGIDGPPREAWASAWPRALPIYDDAYREAVAAAEAALVPAGVWLAGSHYHGAGIDAAVLSAERVATAIIERT